MIGIDLVRVGRVEDLLARWGDRFLMRCFTEGEIAYCEARPARRAVHYAGRIAVKEAVAKALGTGIAQGVAWRQIEVVRAPGGPPTVRLHGAAERIARDKGVGGIEISITHETDLAAAVAFLHIPPMG